MRKRKNRLNCKIAEKRKIFLNRNFAEKRKNLLNRNFAEISPLKRGVLNPRFQGVGDFAGLKMKFENFKNVLNGVYRT